MSMRFPLGLAIIGLAWLVLMGTIFWAGAGKGVGGADHLAAICGSIGVLVAAIAVERVAAQRRGMVDRYLVAASFSAQDEAYLIPGLVRQRARPLVEGETKPAKLATAAANLVREALASPAVLDYQIVFFGAVALQSPSDDWRHDEETGATLSPHQVYHGALEEIASKGIPLARFVGLLTKDEFKNRSAAVKKRYQHWLSSQRSQMKRNPNFVLIDSPRATKWGATGGGIMSATRMIQFTHRKGFAFILHDDRLMTAIAEPTIEEITKAQSKNIKAYRKLPQEDRGDLTYQYKNIAAFDEYINSIRALE
jgi:hypothetical protein